LSALGCKCGPQTCEALEEVIYIVRVESYDGDLVVWVPAGV
jgi:hypothetical protein